MSIAIRDVREHELDSVLALNNAAGPAILPLDAARVRHLYDTADYFRVAERDGTLTGFLIGFGAHAAHDSSNFAWFREHYPDFFYIDRVVVASRRRGGGVAVRCTRTCRASPSCAIHSWPARSSCRTAWTMPCWSMAASASAKSAST